MLMLRQSLLITTLSMTALVTACNKSAPPAPPSAPAPAASMAPAPTAQPAALPMPVSMTSTINLITDQAVGEGIGSITITETSDGLSLKADLRGLAPGEHGFHVHQNGNCGPAMKDGKQTAGEAAGEHYDPTGQGKHAGPDGAGHAGDLPRLTVAADGTATGTVSIGKLKLADLKGRSLMIHAGADDYGTAPGGARVACGVLTGTAG